jgi:pimeloyl-ACP methyl ester carboxylesterase
MTVQSSSAPAAGSAAADYEDRFHEINGCRLHYLDWGNAAAPPLLLVHGLTQQAHFFDALARHLRGRFHCLALDVRGRGESAWAPPESYNNAQYARDVLGLLDALGIARTDYVGTSMGGIIAMTLAREAPQRLGRVVLNDIGPEIALAGVRRINESVAKRAGSFASLEAYIDEGLLPFYYFLKARPREQLRELARWMVREQDDGRWVSRYDPAVRSAVQVDAAALKAVADFLWVGFKALSGPLLLVRGGLSDLLAPESVRAMRAAQPRLQLVEVPGASHAPLLDEALAVAALDDFFA